MSERNAGSGWVLVSGAGPWTSYTPTFANVTLGLSVVAARYQRIGQTINAIGRVTLGAGFTMGANPTISLPVPAASWIQSDTPLGPATFLDSGSTYYAAWMRYHSTTQMMPIPSPSGTGIAATVPFVWAVNDAVLWNITYEAA